MLRWFNSQNKAIDGIKYSGGSGTEVNPYLIATLSDLEELSEYANPIGGRVDYIGDWVDKYFKQTNNISAASTGTWNNGLGFSSIGNNTNQFYSSYNGDDYSISDLHINRPLEDTIGLFGRITGNCILSGIKLINVDVSAESKCGALVGVSITNAIGGINDCSSSGRVEAINSISDSWCGGLVGSNYSNVTKCNSSCTVTGKDRVGGLFGMDVFSSVLGYNSKTNDCYATGDVGGTAGVGGLVGVAGSTTRGHVEVIDNCYSTGIVSGVSDFGGLIGAYEREEDPLVTSSYWDKEASNQLTSIGGTGKTTLEMKTESTFTGWDFTAIWGIDPLINNGYPYLK